MLYIFLFSVLFRQAQGSLSLVQPLQSQLPLIARVYESYSWTFVSPFLSSKSNSSSEISYNVTSAPSWLQFQSSTLTFTGTPQASDIGDPTIVLEGNDGESSCFDKITLCVTDFPAPKINNAAQAQFFEGNPSLSSVFTLAPTSALSPPSGEPTLRVPPGWSFSIGFASSTFMVMPNQSLFYYASHLPDWMSFNNNGLDFDGIAPKLPLNTTSSFRLTIFGSDQQGFSAVNQTWNLIVAAHELGQNRSLPTLVLTSGQKIDRDIGLDDLDGIVFDKGALESLTNLSVSIDTSCCSWLTASNLSLSGRAPNRTATFVLPLALSYPSINQTLHTMLNLSVLSSVFTQFDFPVLILSPGTQVNFDLHKYLVDPDDSSALNITMSAPDAPWLSFSSQTLRLSGTAPKNGSGTKLSVKFTARDTQNDRIYTAELPISIDEQSQQVADSSSSISPKKLRTILASVFGCIAGFIICCAFAACCRARQKAKRIKNQGMYVIDQRGQGYWREKGALDTEFTYANPSESTLKSGEPAFEEVHLTPIPNNAVAALEIGSTHGTQGTPSSLIPGGGGKMRKGEFFTRVRNSISRKNKKRPLISNPVPFIISTHDAPVSNTVNGSYIDSSFSTDSTELELVREKATRRPDFMPPDPNRPPFVPRPSLSDHRASIDSFGSDITNSAVVSAEPVSIKEGKPRLVEFKQAKKGTTAIAHSPYRNVSQQAVIGTSISPDIAGPTVRMITPQTPRRVMTESLKSMHVRPNQPFSWAAPFPIPPSHPNLRAILEDGRKLPPWLKFEPGDGEFWGIWYPSSPTKIGARTSLSLKSKEEDLMIVVKAGDAEVGRFLVVIDS